MKDMTLLAYVDSFFSGILVELICYYLSNSFALFASSSWLVATQTGIGNHGSDRRFSLMPAIRYKIVTKEIFW